MSTQRALKRSRARKGATQAPPAGLPSLHSGMRGLNHLAGNQALAAVLARRPQKEPWRAKGPAEPPEGEEELAALRLVLDEFEKLMDRLEKERDGGRAAYRDLRAWILEMLKRLHLALEGTDDYDGGLEELVADLERLPQEAGQNRLEVLAQLAQKLQADGEKAYGHLSKQLPAPGSPQQKPLQAGTIAKELSSKLAREVAKAKKEADADVEPAAALAALAGGGGLTLGRRRRRKKKRP